MIANDPPIAAASSDATCAMMASWRVPTQWDVTTRNGISAVLWDQDTAGPVALACGLDDDHLIFSLHLTGFSFATVELDGRTCCADALPGGSWMLVDTAGRPKAETKGTFRLLHIYIPKSLIADTCAMYDLTLPSPHRALYHSGRFGDGPISGAAMALGTAASQNGPLRHLTIDNATNGFLVDLITLLHAAPQSARKTSLSPTSRQCIETYIATHLDAPISLDDLATAAGLSKFHFLRAFKADYGMTPMTALRERRLAAARDLLTGSTDTVTQIALQCGFSDHSHFSSCFRDRFGQRPSDYRRSFRKIS